MKKNRNSLLPLVLLIVLLSVFEFGIAKNNLSNPEVGGNYTITYAYDTYSINGIIQWKKKTEHCEEGGNKKCTEGKCYYNEYDDGEPGEWVTPCPPPENPV